MQSCGVLVRHLSGFATNQDLAVTAHKSLKWAINSSVVRIIAIFNYCPGRTTVHGFDFEVNLSADDSSFWRRSSPPHCTSMVTKYSFRTVEYKAR